MHILLLAIGILLGLYGLYRFFMNASVKQVYALIVSAIFVIFCIALLYLALTGKLPAAIAMVAAIWPLALSYWKEKNKKPGEKAGKPSASEPPMTVSEAYKVLGLKEGAGEDDIHEAYKKLMKKVHPDQEGSEWMASKLNQAKDLLLKK